MLAADAGVIVIVGCWSDCIINNNFKTFGMIQLRYNLNGFWIYLEYGQTETKMEGDIP